MDNTSSGPRSGQLPQDVYVRWSGRDKATHWLLFALAVVAGIQTGGVIFDTLVNDQVWSDSVAAARAWNEDVDPSRFYIAFTNGVFLLAIATLVVGWRSPRPVRGWLRWATGFFIVAVAITIAYFLPEIQEIRGASAGPIPDGELAVRIGRWTLLDPVRELFIFAGFVLTVRAVGLSHAARARAEILSEGRLPPSGPETGGSRAYPHTIDNGAGERLTFLRRVPGATGDRLEVENAVEPGAGPVMHVHHHQEEALTVERGRIGYGRPGEPARFAGPGETVVFRAGEAHRFWNAGEETLRCTGYIEPADNVEYFLAEIFGSQKRSGGSRPNPLDAAFLARRYRSEFGMVGIPAPVQRLVFPVLVAVGTLLGRYGRYADAPEPVHR